MANEGSEPIASVIVPAFNAASAIEVQLAALAREPEIDRCEVLVCDNGSTDATRAVVERWSRSLGCIRLIDASRGRGPAVARNEGAAQSRSSRLLFCDADDRVAEGWIAALCRGLDVAAMAVGAIYETRRRPLLRATPPWVLACPVYKAQLPWLPAGGSANMAVRRDVFRAAGGFDEGFRAGEDIDLCWRIQLAGERLAFCPGAVVEYSPRVGLAATFRQAGVHALGDALLLERYGETGGREEPRREVIEVPSDRGSEPHPRADVRRGRLSPGRLSGSVAWRLGQRLHATSRSRARLSRA